MSFDWEVVDVSPRLTHFGTHLELITAATPVVDGVSWRPGRLYFVATYPVEDNPKRHVDPREVVRGLPSEWQVRMQLALYSFFSAVNGDRWFSR